MLYGNFTIPYVIIALAAVLAFRWERVVFAPFAAAVILARLENVAAYKISGWSGVFLALCVVQLLLAWKQKLKLSEYARIAACVVVLVLFSLTLNH
jgi:hypothetical protein